jgi:large subunit ribosomal protein L14
MISVGTTLKIIDNSGGKKAECIRILGESGRGFGFVGDIVIVAIKYALPGKKVKKGQVQRGVIVRVAKEVRRKSGEYVKCADNAIVIINKKNMPVGTRILGSVMQELRVKGFVKIVGLATGII